jgi:hypothetical protein
MASTITLQQVVNLAATHGELMPLAGVGGYQNEPALSLCNDTMQELLAHPHDFKFNRWEMPMFVTGTYQQDYLFAGATAFQLASSTSNQTPVPSASGQIDLASNSAITVTGGTVTVNLIQGQLQNGLTVGATVYMTGVMMTTGTTANYNSIQNQTGSSWSWTGGWLITAVTPTSFSFAAVTGQNNADVGGAPGITNFGWLASATITELNNNSPVGNIRPIEAVRNLAPSQRINQPTKLCHLKTYQNAAGQDTGIIKLRLENPCGPNLWMVNPVYQAKAPIFLSLAATWAPFPDEYSYVYRQGLLARMYRYLNAPSQNAEYQKLEAAIQKATGADDREMSDVHVYPEQPLVEGGWGGWM